MKATEAAVTEFEQALSSRLGNRVVESESPTEWKDVRAKINTDPRGCFLDLGMGGSGVETHFATAPDGPLRSQEGDAYGFYKVRLLEDGTWRLEIHSMAADWHRGKEVDPSNVKARIALGQAMSKASMPAWTPGEEWRIAKLEYRSAMVWKRTLGDHDDMAALADEVIRALEAARPHLSHAVAER